MFSLNPNNSYKGNMILIIMAKLVDIQDFCTHNPEMGLPQYRRVCLVEGGDIEGIERYDLLLHPTPKGYVLEAMKLEGKSMNSLSVLDIPADSIGKMFAYAQKIVHKVTKEFEKGKVPDLGTLVLA